jgi:serine phosphatase RsbU (regulator of sigma subunit)
MASVRAALRAEVDNVYYLYEVVRRLNIMVHRDSRLAEFVTLFYGVLDSGNRRLTYCNAGHPAGLLLRQGQIIELKSENMVLGIDPEEQYHQTVVDLKSQDLILLYTDGLSDARNAQQEFFGRQRVVEAFKQGGATAEAAAHNVVEAMRAFVGASTKPVDDVTMIVAKVN